MLLTFTDDDEDEEEDDYDGGGDCFEKRYYVLNINFVIDAHVDDECNDNR